VGREGGDVIDWTKPIEFLDGVPARVERITDNGRAVVSWHNGSSACAFNDAQVGRVLRNVQPKPREGWVPGNYLDMTEAEATRYWGKGTGETLVRVRELMPGEE
jgi:hypothetical protein